MNPVRMRKVRGAVQCPYNRPGGMPSRRVYRTNSHCHFFINAILNARTEKFPAKASNKASRAMNLSQLRYARAVAERGNFTLAAEQCYVTQPTLSNGIAQLEQELEERLFKRTTRSVSLTPFGEHIMPFIDTILKAHDDLLRETRNFAHPSRTAVRIGISPLINPGWLTSMLEKFRGANSRAEVILHEQNMADLYRMLDEGLLDFVFGVADTRKPSWNNARLYSEPLHFIPRGTQYPEDEGAVPFERIAGETFVMVPNVCGLARATRSLFRSHRRKLNEYSGEALSYQVLEQWASLGLGAAILPKSKLRSLERKTYALTDKNGKELALDFEAVWLASAGRTEHLRQFMAFLKKYRADAEYVEKRPVKVPGSAPDG